MKTIKEIAKNYFRVGSSGACSVIVDTYLMKKVVKLEQEFDIKIKKLLNDNIKHCENESWGLCYPNKKQTSFYGINVNNPYEKKRMINNSHKTSVTKIDLLFDMNGQSVHDKGIEKYLNNYLSERIKGD